MYVLENHAIPTVIAVGVGCAMAENANAMVANEFGYQLFTGPNNPNRTKKLSSF